MLRKGFTLIELLIVITIIAILAGAAIPYVADYVEDARLSKVRADLDEIKNALLRYELDTGKLWVNVELTDLVGPYLSKALADPWGTPYKICASSSIVFSYGPDRVTNYTPNVSAGTIAGTADDIAVDFRAPMAMTRATYIDANKDGLTNAGDLLKVRFTRELADNTAFALAGADFQAVVGTSTPTLSTLTFSTVAGGTDGRESILTLATFGVATFTPGRDSLQVLEIAASEAVDKAMVPYDQVEAVNAAIGNRAKTNLVTIKAL